MLGVYGQHLFVDPELRLVMVQTSANQTASVAKTSLGRERNAFWRGLVDHYGRW
jgi:CubicO group peptidase (beta-lactamase class C family)